MTNDALPRFDPMPSLHRVAAVQIGVSPRSPQERNRRRSARCRRGDVGATLGVDRKQLRPPGFDGDDRLDGRGCRSARAAPPWRSASVSGDASMPPGCATRPRHSPAPRRTRGSASASRAESRGSRRRRAQAVVEGVLLARYRYDPLRSQPQGTPVDRAHGRRRATATSPPPTAGAERGRAFAAGHPARPRPGQLPAQPPRRAPASPSVAVALGADARARGRGVRQGRADRDGLRRAARRQRRQRRAAAR